MSQRHRVFIRMWGVAVIAHLAGNWAHGDIWPEATAVGIVLLLVGLVGTGAIVAGRRWMLLALGVLVPAAAVLEAPRLGNHWLLAAFVSLAYLLTGGRWERFEPAARLILIVFYAFAAFAKLNHGFLDPVTSCGLFYTNQWLEAAGFRSIAATSPLAWIAAWGSGLVELSIPILLLVRRTRPIGVPLGLAFHGLISLDLAQHFYDFTAVLFALFVLFLPDTFAERMERVARQLRPGLRSAVAGLVAVAGVTVTVASVMPLTPSTAWLLTTGSFLWWIPFLALTWWSAVGALSALRRKYGREFRRVSGVDGKDAGRRRTRGGASRTRTKQAASLAVETPTYLRRGALGPAALDWRLGPAAAVILCLVALNGLTPYLELKTAYGWNMYSNLVTVDGYSNHLVVRSTLPLRDGHRDLVTVVSSADPGLQVYADEGYLLPWPSLRLYAAANPEASLVMERSGTTIEVPRAGDHPELGAPVPWWWRWMPLRAVHGESPEQCQPVFLPAL